MADSHETVSETPAAPSESYLTASRGLRSWLFTVDHKRIAILYLVAIALFFLVAGALALVIRLELFWPKATLIKNSDTYNKVFTVHGAVMVFLFIIPSIPAVFGNFFVPILVGAKDVAFPRMNLASFYVYGLGGIVFLIVLVLGSIDTGWTFYTPYSSGGGHTQTPVIWAVAGAFILGFSSIMTGLNFIVTIHKMRTQGMTWYRMPLFCWAIYATSLIQILATPVLGITLLLLAFERYFQVGIFDPSLGGDPLLFQHFFWFYSHPAVYIMVLPAFGVMSEIFTVHSRKRIFGYKAIALSSVAIAVIGFLVWGHHMFTSGQSYLASMIFSFLTFLVAVPTSIKVFSWVATLYKGSIALTPPMLYGLAFILLFMVGGFTGIFLGTLSIDVHLHDTYFVVAHFHYTMMGGAFIGFLAALHHWWPKMFGKMYNQRAATLGALWVTVAFNLTFLPQFVLGAQGMPRRYHTYDMINPAKLPMMEHLHRMSTVGAMLLGTGLLFTVGYFVWSLLKGPKAAPNQWDGVSLEWQTATPPGPHNFEDVPVVTHGPYEFPEIDRSGAKA